MHYDKKIAFALSVLLVGTVAAFFFRRKANSRETAPQLADAKALDAKIADKPIRPYELPGSQQSASASRNKQKLTRTGAMRIKVGDSGFPAALRIVQRTTTNGSPGTRLGPPRPIHRKDGERQTNYAPMPAPKHNAAWQSGSTKSPVAKKPPSRRMPATAFREYRVKSGDTLSGIAYRFLGSSLRYQEIYEANHSRMRSPNDIRVGMVLRIPTNAVKNLPPPPTHRKTERDRSVKRRSNPGNGVRNLPGPNDKLKPPVQNDRRFVPIRRSPFIHDSHVRNLPDWNAKAKSIQKAPASKPRHYVVKRGDSLERIAIRYYGTRRAIPKIVAANRRRLKSNRLLAGTKLILP